LQRAVEDISPRLVAVAHKTLAPVKPSAAATNKTRVDSSRDIVPDSGTITTSAIRQTVCTQAISSAVADSPPGRWIRTFSTAARKLGISEASQTSRAALEPESDIAADAAVGELDELVLAYATTIHKSQGSEYPAVVIPLSTQHYPMLQRNLVYTGVTRGKRLVVLVGQRKALAIAVKGARARRRWSKLRNWLAVTESQGHKLSN
jgi:hypothetical protein